MITCIRGADDGTITVLSGNVVVGGVTLSDAGGWIWALFAMRETEIHGASPGGSAKFYGTAASEAEALSALKERWSRWLDDAELVCRAPVDPRALSS